MIRSWQRGKTCALAAIVASWDYHRSVDCPLKCCPKAAQKVSDASRGLLFEGCTNPRCMLSRSEMGCNLLTRPYSRALAQNRTWPKESGQILEASIETTACSGCMWFLEARSATAEAGTAEAGAPIAFKQSIISSSSISSQFDTA